MPDFTPIRACIFDVDGLLINSEDIYSLAMNNVLREYGKPDCPWDVKAIMQSRSRTVSTIALWKIRNLTLIGPSKLYGMGQTTNLSR